MPSVADQAFTASFEKLAFNIETLLYGPAATPEGERHKAIGGSLMGAGIGGGVGALAGRALTANRYGRLHPLRNKMRFAGTTLAALLGAGLGHRIGAAAASPPPQERMPADLSALRREEGSGPY